MDSSIRETFRYFQSTKDFSTLSKGECQQLITWLTQHLKDLANTGTYSVYLLRLNVNLSAEPRDEDRLLIAKTTRKAGEPLANYHKIIMEYDSDSGEIKQLTVNDNSSFSGKPNKIYLMYTYIGYRSDFDNNQDPIVVRSGIFGSHRHQWHLRPEAIPIIKAVVEARLRREAKMREVRQAKGSK